MHTPSAVLKSKRGFATVFGLGFMAIIIMFAIGVAIVNYSQQSSSITTTKNQIAGIESRANLYAGEMNKSLTDDTNVPATAYAWDTRTRIGTEITSVVKSTGVITLTIKASDLTKRFTTTRVLSLESTEATLVTGYDSAQNIRWADSSDTGKFILWTLAEGTIRTLTTSELAGSATGMSWKTAGTRSGIDIHDHLWMWGANDQGQAGVGSNSTVTQPKSVMPTSTWISVVTDPSSTFGIDSHGKIWAWGSNADNKLGTGSASSSPSSMNFPYIARSVATGGNSSFAIDSRGRLWAWGLNTSGRLGTGSGAPSLTDAAQVSPGTLFASVSTSGGSTYAVDQAGKIWAWGVNTSGRLGTGSGAAVLTAPQAVANIGPASSVNTGGTSVVAIDTTGHLWAWGAARRTGNGSTATSAAPVSIVPGTTFSSAVAGTTTSYAITSAGKVYVWGDNDIGQFGDGSTLNSATAKAILPTLNFSGVGNGGNYISFVDFRGGLWAFGTQSSGLWPLNFTNDPSRVIKMPLPDGFVKGGW